MHINKLRDSKFLKKEDCDPPIRVTIRTLTEENVGLEGEKDMKYALHFDEVDKPLILNTTNGQLIAKSLGTEETDEWSGQQVELYNDPNVSYQGKLIGGIRVRGVAKGKKAKAEVEDDEIPF